MKVKQTKYKGNKMKSKDNTQTNGIEQKRRNVTLKYNNEKETNK